MLYIQLYTLCDCTCYLLYWFIFIISFTPLLFVVIPTSLFKLTICFFFISSENNKCMGHLQQNFKLLKLWTKFYKSCSLRKHSRDNLLLFELISCLVTLGALLEFCTNLYDPYQESLLWFLILISYGLIYHIPCRKCHKGIPSRNEGQNHFPLFGL